MKVAIEKIGPKRAIEYLRQSDNIRKPNRLKIANFRRDMKANRWEQNGESIKFYTNGKGEFLRDGQNRLHAIKDSKTTQDFVVVRDIDGSDYVDVGEKRTLAQLLHHDGVSYACNHAAAVSNLLAYDRFSTGQLDTYSSRPSHSDRIECFQKYRSRLTKIVPLVHNTKKLHWRAAISAVLVHGSCPSAYGAAKDEFLYYLSTGEDLQQNDALYALREEMHETSRRRIRQTQRHRLALIVQAWNWHRSLQLMATAKSLKFIETGPTAMKFPKIQ
jgi:hypothetical protein